MRTLAAIAFSAAAIVFASIPTTSVSACGSLDDPCTPRYSGAPGPIAGAGIPALAIIGGGAYLLVRRMRRNKR
jgi:hypothetical protein